MLIVGELGLILACFVIAIAAMVWYGRRNSHRLSQKNGFVFVTYPVLVLLFLVMGAATMLNALWDEHRDLWAASFFRLGLTPQEHQCSVRVPSETCVACRWRLLTTSGIGSCCP